MSLKTFNVINLVIKAEYADAKDRLVVTELKRQNIEQLIEIEFSINHLLSN